MIFGYRIDIAAFHLSSCALDLCPGRIRGLHVLWQSPVSPCEDDRYMSMTPDLHDRMGDKDLVGTRSFLDFHRLSLHKVLFTTPERRCNAERSRRGSIAASWEPWESIIGKEKTPAHRKRPWLSCVSNLGRVRAMRAGSDVEPLTDP
jgi:hypothetical protein